MPNNNSKSPSGLDGLLSANNTAQQYFSSLPVYVQEMIMQRKQNIHSEDDLRSYAENIVQGDK